MSRGGARLGAGRPRKTGDQVGLKSPCFYIVHEVENPGLCKVGLTTMDPRARLSGMQSLNPRPLKLAGVLRVQDRDKVWEIERALMALLVPFRSAGAWFAADPDQIVSEAHIAAMACGSALVLEDASDHARGTRGGARPGAGRPGKTASPGKAAPARP